MNYISITTDYFLYSSEDMITFLSIFFYKFVQIQKNWGITSPYSNLVVTVIVSIRYNDSYDIKIQTVFDNNMIQLTFAFWTLEVELIF